MTLAVDDNIVLGELLVYFFLKDKCRKKDKFLKRIILVAKCQPAAQGAILGQKLDNEHS